MHPSPIYCEPCGQAGVKISAEYVYQAEETSLAGPTMGDPDYWPPDVSGQRYLCQEHYARLPADSRLDYAPAEDNHDENHFGQFGEMERKSL